MTRRSFGVPSLAAAFTVPLLALIAMVASGCGGSDSTAHAHGDDAALKAAMSKSMEFYQKKNGNKSPNQATPRRRGYPAAARRQ